MKTSNRGSKPGERRGGRKKGTPNKITGQLKEAILAAAEAAGGPGGTVGYLTLMATTNPAPFLGLLGKVLPTTLAGDPDQPVRHEVSWLKSDA